jgi:tetratricopeptide (TPR) repeat protein
LHLAATGDLLRAIEQISIARECDPLSPIIETHTAAILYWARLFDLAAEQCNRAIEAEHSQFWYMHHLLGLVYEQRGQMEEAREEQQTAAKLYDEAQEQNASAEGSARARSALVGAALARAHALCGDRGKAAQELGNLRARGTRAAALYHTATAYTALGDVDAAFAHLRSACNQGDVWASFLAVDPRLDALRGDRRLSSLQRELDLPAAAARSPELSRKDITMVRRWLEL